jgi:glycosyltransferase involved in cell wall biosynthesis
VSVIGLSIIICTFNRAKFLDELLASIDRELCERLDLEVVVIDNNSVDDTADVVARYEGRLPGLRRIVERNQGLSFARNRGAAETSKAYILYLDDDAVLSDGFLDRAEVVLRRFGPDLFGGPVLPRFDREVPAWFDQRSEIRCYEPFSCFSAEGTISGGNFGIAREVLQRLGPFNTELGMKSEQMGFGEDREMVERYRAQTPAEKQRLYYAVELPVIHYTMPYKLDKKYQWERKFKTASAQERTLIKTGKRSLLKSLILVGGHIAFMPVFAGRLAMGPHGLSARNRYKIVRHLYSTAGRLHGALLMAKRTLASRLSGKLLHPQNSQKRVL